MSVTWGGKPAPKEKTVVRKALKRIGVHANHMPPLAGQARKLIHIPRKTRKLMMVEVTKRVV
jgi:hypothetical protein